MVTRANFWKTHSTSFPKFQFAGHELDRFFQKYVCDERLDGFSRNFPRGLKRFIILSPGSLFLIFLWFFTWYHRNVRVRTLQHLYSFSHTFESFSKCMTSYWVSLTRLFYLQIKKTQYCTLINRELILRLIGSEYKGTPKKIFKIELFSAQPIKCRLCSEKTLAEIESVKRKLT